MDSPYLPLCIFYKGIHLLKIHSDPVYHLYVIELVCKQDYRALLREKIVCQNFKVDISLVKFE